LRWDRDGELASEVVSDAAETRDDQDAEDEEGTALLAAALFRSRRRLGRMHRRRSRCGLHVRLRSGGSRWELRERSARGFGERTGIEKTDGGNGNRLGQRGWLVQHRR